VGSHQSSKALLPVHSGFFTFLVSGERHRRFPLHGKDNPKQIIALLP
jgi:hypothetical protein